MKHRSIVFHGTPRDQNPPLPGHLVTTTLAATRRMIFMALALVVARQFMGQTGSPKPFAPPETGLVLFRNASLIDGSGGAPRKGMDILIRGERIERVLPDADIDSKLIAGAKVISLNGQFLIPGLIDAHVHLATPP
jgi:hypothetical protein